MLYVETCFETSCCSVAGHQWVKNNLGLTPKSGWSIDPFGHGSTVPYLLKMSGISGTIIQRIHYTWKQWLAERQMGDFLWRQNWDADGHTDLLIHNQPFDIYSIKHSCGPHPQVCLNFDFRKIPGTSAWWQAMLTTSCCDAVGAPYTVILQNLKPFRGGFFSFPLYSVFQQSSLHLKLHDPQSHYVEESFWRRLWTCRQTEYWMNEWMNEWILSVERTSLLFYLTTRTCYCFSQIKSKGKGHPITGHEGPEGEQRYSSTFSLTSALDGGGWSTPRTGRFPPGKDPVPIS